MIRNLLHLTLIGILLISSTGFAVSFHFCGDSLVSVFINSEDEPCCGEKSTCCENKTDYLQLDEEGLSPDQVSSEKKETTRIVELEDVEIDKFYHHSFQQIHFQKTAFSPPLYGTSILASLQTYLL